VSSKACFAKNFRNRCWGEALDHLRRSSIHLRKIRNLLGKFREQVLNKEIITRLELVIKQGAAKHLLMHHVKCKNCPFRKGLWCVWHATFLGEAMIKEGIIEWEGNLSEKRARKLLKELRQEAPQVAEAIEQYNQEDFEKFITEEAL